MLQVGLVDPTGILPVVEWNTVTVVVDSMGPKVVPELMMDWTRQTPRGKASVNNLKLDSSSSLLQMRLKGSFGQVTSIWKTAHLPAISLCIMNSMSAKTSVYQTVV